MRQPPGPLHTPGPSACATSPQKAQGASKWSREDATLQTRLWLQDALVCPLQPGAKTLLRFLTACPGQGTTSWALRPNTPPIFAWTERQRGPLVSAKARVLCPADVQLLPRLPLARRSSFLYPSGHKAAMWPVTWDSAPVGHLAGGLH